MRVFSLLFIVLFVGLPALWYVPAMMWGFQITKEASSEDGAISEELIGGPAPVRWFRNQRELRDYYSPDELTYRREVSFEMDMDFTDLLAPGEAVPEEALQDLYVKARAPAFLIAYCPEILGPLASKCGVGDATGRIGRDGRASVRGSLTYLPNYELGNVADVENGQVMLASVRLFPRDADLESTPENRAAAITKALELCDLIRDRFGNCLISDLILEQDRKRWAEEDEPYILTATARFAIHADKTVFRRESLKDEVDRITDPLTN